MTDAQLKHLYGKKDSAIYPIVKSQLSQREPVLTLECFEKMLSQTHGNLAECIAQVMKWRLEKIKGLSFQPKTKQPMSEVEILQIDPATGNISRSDDDDIKRLLSILNFRR